ncbi:hypothetical protein HYH03_009532 [Edaphochlamys debaryana]|uniref:Uncharacterized protein n=1 Tax=Edaphochlamys debaryana TaxID=47281 RepID=A0A835XZ63_9CHLO|nr:hypothetical protein HYH03_009529 [Edaphochlamys debaryana]KAG2492292.1 hypothetical protein HYH03_009532 [Edaphochlamys debaryana]|eukprot:KAG2492289.1 hypothetical protein HYH03_009529 [Edaphochlamys debaryana]
MARPNQSRFAFAALSPDALSSQDKKCKRFTRAASPAVSPSSGADSPVQPQLPSAFSYPPAWRPQDPTRVDSSVAASFWQPTHVVVWQEYALQGSWWPQAVVPAAVASAWGH